MRALFDILHPAHVHFFRNSIRILEKEGCEVIVTSRKKDVTLDLLERYEIDNLPLSAIGSNKLALGTELLGRTRRLRRIVRKMKPDVLAGVMGVSIAPVGWASGIPTVVFYGTESARLSNRWVYAMADEFITPEGFRERLGRKHTTYRTTQELAYLHPDYFSPDRGALSRAGIAEEAPFSILRFVSWGASHDVGHRGLTPKKKAEVFDRLRELGSVFISSEGGLPSALEPHRLSADPTDVHSLLAYAKVLFGESATMAAEAAILGTPAVYVDDVGRGFTDDLERQYGLVCNVPETEEGVARGLSWAMTVAASADEVGDVQEQRDRLLGQAPDLPRFIVDKLHARVKDKAGTRRP